MAENMIRITACDNQLLLVAYQWGASFVIGNINSGNSQPVNVALPLVAGQYQGGLQLNGVNSPLSGSYPVTLAPGQYQLVAIGIDWGGPQAFTFTLNGQTYSLPPSNNGDGVVWTTGPIALTI
ncbi:hypothetical protein [Leeia sp.]|uniref:hypothetical protein n=1 Tax=Leeia sp. TaxID=2884678 RepID=UPI0035B2C069